MQLPNPDPTTNRPEYAGRDRHIALSVNNIDILKNRLESKGISYTFSSSGRRALFCRDIDGNGYEFMEDSLLDS
jgi:glyoxylase I family protein